MRAADRARWLLITGGGLGLAPIAPGTFGTLPGVMLAMLLGVLWGGVALALALALTAAVLLAFGCAQSRFVQRTFEREDPGPFVLDEVVGYLVAAALFTAFVRDLSPVGHGVCFLAFRACDVIKPPPARRLEELPGAPGIMLDDVAAGAWAALLVGIVAGLGWF